MYGDVKCLCTCVEVYMSRMKGSNPSFDLSVNTLSDEHFCKTFPNTTDASVWAPWRMWTVSHLTDRTLHRSCYRGYLYSRTVQKPTGSEWLSDNRNNNNNNIITAVCVFSVVVLSFIWMYILMVGMCVCGRGCCGGTCCHISCWLLH